MVSTSVHILDPWRGTSVLCELAGNRSSIEWLNYRALQIRHMLTTCIYNALLRKCTCDHQQFENYNTKLAKICFKTVGLQLAAVCSSFTLLDLQMWRHRKYDYQRKPNDTLSHQSTERMTQNDTRKFTLMVITYRLCLTSPHNAIPLALDGAEGLLVGTKNLGTNLVSFPTIKRLQSTYMLRFTYKNKGINNSHDVQDINSLCAFLKLLFG